MIRQLEEQFKKTLQWLICQLHTNEFPLHHLFQHLDGKKSGPLRFSGLLGKHLEVCTNFQLSNLYALEVIHFFKNQVDLSVDQKYLYEICSSISSGICTIDLSKRNPGKQAHSRWLTTANRILR